MHGLHSKQCYVQSLPPPARLFFHHLPLIFHALELKKMNGYCIVILQVGPRSLSSPGLREQVRLAGAVLACASAAEGAGLGDADGGGIGGSGAGLEGLEELDDGLGGEVLVVVVVDLDHGGVDAGAEALDFEDGEEAVSCGLALLDAEVVLDGLDDDV